MKALNVRLTSDELELNLCAPFLLSELQPVEYCQRNPPDAAELPPGVSESLIR